MIVVRDYHPKRRLDCLLKESTTLYAVLQNSDESQDRFKNPTQEAAETHIKRDSLRLQREVMLKLLKTAVLPMKGKLDPIQMIKRYLLFLIIQIKRSSL